MKFVFFALVPLFFAQPIRTFCIYNNLNEGSHIIAKQDRKDLSNQKVFLEKLNQNEKKCCHFSNLDCSPYGRDYDPVDFTIDFVRGPLDRVIAYRVSCTTGGGLDIYSDKDSRHRASCTFANGTTTEVPFVEIINN